MKDPAVLFYTSDFLTSTMFLTDEQVGKYIRLLCAQHQQGRLSEKHMLKICSARDEDIFCKFKVDKNGFYYNVRLESEILKRKKYSESRAKNRRGKGKKICETYVRHMGNGNEIENVIIDKDEYKKLVDRFGSKQTDWMIEKLDNYLANSDRKYKSYYRVILGWVKDEYEKQHPKTDNEDIKFRQ